MRCKLQITYKKILFVLFALYSIAPEYFRIGNINSPYIFLACIVIVFTLFLHKIFIEKHVLLFTFAVFFFQFIPLLISNQYSQIILTFLERVLLVLIISSTVDNKKDLHDLINILIIVSLIESITSIIHFVSDFNVFSILSNTTDTAVLGSDTQYRNGMPRVEGSFGHAITYAIYVSISAILALYMYTKTKQKKYIYVYILLLLTLLCTQARIPTLIFILVQICYIMSFNYKKAINILVKGLVASTIFCILLYIIIPESIKPIYDMFLQMFSSESLNGIKTYSDSSPFAYRFEMLRVIPSLLHNSWIFGKGNLMSNFSFVIGNHNQTSIDNQYLYSLVANGIFGFASTLIWIFGGIVLSTKKKISMEFQPFLLMIFVLYALNLFSVAEMNEHRMVVLIIGILFSCIRISKKTSCTEG